jgi:hypothetical protein
MAESGCLQSLRVSNLEVSQDVRIESDAVIEGDLTVNGTTTSLQTVNTVVKDTIFELNNGYAGANNTNDIGILMERGTDAGEPNAFMGWDELADQFVIGTTEKNADYTGNLEVTEGTFRVNTLTGPTDATLTVSAAGTGALDIDAAGAVTIDSTVAGVSIDGVDDSNLTVTGDAKNLTLSAVGGGAQVLAINSAGVGENAITLTSTAGGVDIDAATGKDVSISGGQVLLTSKTDEASAISLTTNVGTNETIVLTNTLGTGPGAINLESSAGGVLVSADGNIANAIKLHATAGAAQTIVLENTAGTDEDAITLTSTAGGVDIDAATGKDVSISGGQVLLTSKTDEASAISLTTNVGTNETIVLTNTKGTDAGAISLTSTAGGITLSSGGAESVTVTNGRFQVDDETDATSTTDGSLQTDGGLSVALSAVIGDDLDLLSDLAIFKIGVNQPFTLTHSNSNNTVMASANHRLAFGDAGEYITGDETDLKIVSSNNVDITATLVNITGALTTSGGITATGRVQVNDATDATSTTDGSLQTDGGLSVAMSAVIGDDLDLLSDLAVFKIGDGQPFTLTHSNANNTVMASANHRLAFGDAGEYITGDATDLKIVSSNNVDITATLVNISGALTTSGDANVGGNINVTGDGATLTLKNSQNENEDGEAESIIKFTDHSDAELVRIQGSHDGTNDDTNGDLIFSTNNGTDLTEALRLDSSQVATFAGNVDANAGLDVSGAILTAASGISTSVKNFSNDADGDLEVVDSNKVIIVTNQMAGGRTITLPAVAGAAGVHYLIKLAVDLTGTLNISSDAADELVIGGVQFVDTDTDIATTAQLVQSLAGGADEKIELKVATKAGTWIDLTCSGTHWYITGTVFANTAPTFEDA